MVMLRWIVTLAIAAHLALRCSAQEAEPQSADAATSQAASQPDSQPVTRPVGANDPQHSPRATIREFLLAVNDARNKPERITDAVACMQLTGVPAGVQEKAPQYAERLAAGIGEIFRRKGISTDSVPDDPTGPPFTLFEHEDGTKLVLALQDDGRWRFSSESVIAIDKLEQIYREAAATQPAEPVAQSTAPPEFRSPRATFDTFISSAAAGSWTRAAQCLDLSGLPAAGRADSGILAAQKLREVLTLIKPVVLQDLPDTPTGLPFPHYVDEAGRVEVSRIDAGDRQGCWLFTSATVAKLDLLLKSLRAKSTPGTTPRVSFWRSPASWLRALLPESYEQQYLQIEVWQWIALGTFVLIGELLRRGLARFLAMIVRPLLQTKQSSVVPAVLVRRMRSAAWVLTLLLWWGGIQTIDLQLAVAPYFVVPLKTAIIVFIIWSAYNLLDLVIDNIMVRMQERTRRIDNVIASLAQKTLKVVVVLVGGIWLMNALGFQVEPLLAGLGLGGLAFGLAAQDTLKSFFGSVNVALDRPFHVGDWVRIGDVEGKVESVGLRSSRLRTVDNSELTIPNANIVNAVINNFGRRRYRRIFAVVGVEYSTTPEQLDALCEGLRELIRQNPYANKEEFQVYVDALSASSIDIRLNCYIDVADYPIELETKHRLILDVLRLTQSLGVRIAYPTQTVHFVRDDADAPAVRAASSPVSDEARTRGMEAARRVLAREPVAGGR